MSTPDLGEVRLPDIEALASAISRRLNDQSGLSHRTEAIASSVARRLTGRPQVLDAAAGFDVDRLAEAIVARLGPGTAAGAGSDLPVNT